MLIAHYPFILLSSYIHIQFPANRYIYMMLMKDLHNLSINAFLDIINKFPMIVHEEAEV